MPDVRPFRGLRYDPSAVPDLGTVLCPPYDVISAAERLALAARDPHNAVALELPEASSGGDAYASAARILGDWIADGTLRRDERPLVYVYEQRYSVAGGGQRVARSLFCRLGLEQYGPASGIRPHERTMSGPKEDRFRLLRAVRTNLSPVLLLYDDGAGGAASGRLLDALTEAPPAVCASGPDGVGQALWAIDPADSAPATMLLELAARQPLSIADGHHRYETALRYSAEPDAPPGANWVLALLYDAHSGGLELRPWHRVIAGPVDGAGTIAAAGTVFGIEPVANSAELMARLRLGDPAVPAGTLGLWTHAGGALLTVRSALGARLDVDVLSDTLPQMIGSTTEQLSAAGRLSYVSDASSVIAGVDDGRAGVAFLLRPTPVESVLSVAAAGGFMPAKSTWFGPKAATGLVFNPLFP